MSEIEPFARAVNFANEEYMRGRIIRVHGLVLADKWVGTFIGDEYETKSEIDEINEIVDARVKKAVEEFRERAINAALSEMVRSKSQEDPELAQEERIANRIRALPAVLGEK